MTEARGHPGPHTATPHTATPHTATPWPAPRATRPADAVLALPGSKSLTNRALLLAAIADGPSVVRAAPRSRDSLLMATALTALGAAVDTSGVDWPVTPGALTGGARIDCGLAGTVMRFVPPVAALATGTITFDGDPHMRERPVAGILGALRTLGVDVPGDRLPFAVHGTGSVRGGRVEIDASASSQFISALLLAGARYREGVDVRHQAGPGNDNPVPSLPHIDMTIAMLREHGVEAARLAGDRWRVAPGPVRAAGHTIEPDLSNAAPFLALAALTGGSVTVRDWPRSTTQAGDALREILAQMGCQWEFTGEGLLVTGPGSLTGIDIDLHDTGELTPAVAALCALARTPSRLRGIGHIRGHETDRITALATELSGLGAKVTEHAGELVIEPARLHGGVFHTYADHRMAHAAVIIGAAVDGVLVENIATTGKTFPGFADTWSELFAQ